MTRRIVLSDDAEADDDAAVAWYESRSIGLGAAFQKEVNRSLVKVAEHATLYAKVRGDVRRAAVNRFPYSIYYRITGDVVEVVAIVHDHRDPIIWQSRL